MSLEACLMGARRPQDGPCVPSDMVEAMRNLAPEPSPRQSKRFTTENPSLCPVPAVTNLWEQIGETDP